MYKLRNLIKTAIKNDYSINHIILYIKDNEFSVNIFSDGISKVFSPMTKEFYNVKKVMDKVEIIVPYEKLLKLMKLIKKIIQIYEKRYVKKEE